MRKKAKKPLLVKLSDIDDTITDYLKFRGPLNSHLKKIAHVNLPLDTHGLVDFFTVVKRREIKGWPTDDKGVSLFEAANRILSDLTLFFGVRRILKESELLGLDVTRMAFELNPGVRGGPDLKAPPKQNKCVVVGEAFNVAPSYFARKINYGLKKIRESDYEFINAKYKVIIHNNEGGNTKHYEDTYREIFFIPVNLKNSLKGFL